MPLLAALLRALMLRTEAVIIALWTLDKTVKLAAAAALAAAYVAMVLVFSAFIAPLLSALFSTQWGHVLGLAFPPVAGSVVAGYCALWVAIVAMRYYRTFTSVALK